MGGLLGALASGGSGQVGGGKQSGTSSTISPYAALAAHIGQQIQKEVDPLRAQFLQMLLQVVQQGGSAAGTPMANAATAAAKQAASVSQGQTANTLNRMTGGTANPAAGAIEASQRNQSGFDISQIPTNIGQMLLGLVPGAVSSAGSEVGNMLGLAIGGNRTTTSSGSNTGWNLGYNPVDTAGGPPSRANP